MNVQIFGTKKSFDTKKAQRYFKERRIKVQFIDLKEKEMSKGELTSVMQAVGGIDKLLNPNPKAKDEETLALPVSASINCSKTSRFWPSPSYATVKRPPSVIAPMYGEPGSSLCYLPARGYKSRRLA